MVTGQLCDLKRAIPARLVPHNAFFGGTSALIGVPYCISCTVLLTQAQFLPILPLALERPPFPQPSNT
jgi:hypothetical protein